MMLVKQIYFDKNKKSLKSKDDKNISADKEINLCEKYDIGLSKQHLKHKLRGYLVVMIMERMKEGQ